MATVADVMRQCNNYFETGYRATNYSISGGVLSPSDALRPGMWIYISGSFFWDGVWRVGEGWSVDEGWKLDGAGDGMPDDTFYGRVYFLAPPHEFLALCEEITAYAEKAAVSPYQSESFGEYSYTKAQGKNGGILGWQEAFADRLRPYRRMFTEVG